MKKLLAFALASLTLLPAGALAQDAPKQETARKVLLWKVTGKDLKAPTYLFGTIHIPDKRVTRLPKCVEEARQACDALYCELAMEPSLQLAATKHMMLSDGKTLNDVLGKELVDRAAKLLAKRGLPIAPFLRMKPWAFISQLQMLDYLFELQSGQLPLDAMLYADAKKAGKTVGGLEKLEDQMSVFEGLSAETQKKMVESGLDGMEKAAAEGKKATDKLLGLYLKGDLDAMLELTKEESGEDEESKAFMKKLLFDRNVNMVKEIIRLWGKAPDKSLFVAVGSLHYAGKQGILALLKAEGYTIEAIEK
ncbi:MAG: TraB/GumN family protein [Planctomycetota bacterium]